MNLNDINRLLKGTESNLEFVNKVINDFDNGNLSSIIQHLSEEDRKKVIEKRIELKSITEKISQELQNKGLYDVDGSMLSELKEQVNKIRE